MGSGRRVVIIHPFVQAYRRPLYQALADALPDMGRELVVVWNQPSPRLAGRMDSIRAEWTHPVPARWWTIGGKDLMMRRLGGLELGPNDLVVVEQAVKNLDTYPLLLGSRTSRPRVAMWGHGRSFSTAQSPVLASTKQWLTRRSEWFFAYTKAGADHVVSHGFPRDRVTVLHNTIDTRSLALDLATVDADLARRRLGVQPGRTALFLGGVDRAKGIDFLLSSAVRAEHALPGFTLLVAGEGDESGRVQELQDRGGPVRFLGRVDGSAKAEALAVCDVLAIPEWIGLVAVDSLVAGRPIVSTNHPSHSPEAHYLVDGRTASFARHDVNAYAQMLVDLMTDRPRLEGMQHACREDAGRHSLEVTTEVFLQGIAAWEASGGR